MDIDPEVQAMSELTLNPPPLELPAISTLTLNPAPAELPARPASPVPCYGHARSLLLKAFNTVTARPRPSYQKPETQNALQLLGSPENRDLSLLTKARVEFKIDSRLLADGPKYLEEQLCFDAQQPSLIKLPEEYHPVLVDRLVSFLYTKDYDNPPLWKLSITENLDRILPNASFIPEYSAHGADMLALVDAPRHVFHMHMYGLGERLRYEALMEVARIKTWDILNGVMRSGTAIAAMPLLEDCVGAGFAQSRPRAQVCQDENGTLKQTIVTAVMAHEVMNWDFAQRNALTARLPESRYTEFWTLYDSIAEENLDLITPIREKRREWRRAEEIKRAAHHSKTLKRDIRTATNESDSHISENAQDRRRKKVALRAMPQVADAALAVNAHVFNSVNMERAKANIANAYWMISNPPQMQKPWTLPHCFNPGGQFQPLVPQANYTGFDRSGSSQQGSEGEYDESAVNSTANSTSVRDGQSVQEVQNGMKHLRIDDENHI